MELGRRDQRPDPLAAALRDFVADIAGLQEGETLYLRPADHFDPCLPALEPFAGLVKNENRARNLATFSQLLRLSRPITTTRWSFPINCEALRRHLFNSFLQLLSIC